MPLNVSHCVSPVFDVVLEFAVDLEFAIGLEFAFAFANLRSKTDLDK